MSVARSNSISSFSTTGSSQFQDARSEFTNAGGSVYTDARELKTSTSNIKNIPTNSKQATPELEEVKLESGDGDSDDKKEVTITEDIKTEQPKDKEPPKAYVTREEKIKAAQANRATQSQRDKSECHEYFCSNNMYDVLDLPAINTLFCGLCMVCCNSCFSAGTTTVKTQAMR